MLNTKFESAKVCSISQFEEQNRLEVSLNLADSYYEKVLSVTGDVVSGKCYVQNGELIASGRVVLSVLLSNGDLERVEAGAEFNFKKTGEFQTEVVSVTFQIVNVNLKRNGGMLYAEVVVLSKFGVQRDAEQSFVADLNALKKCQDVELESILSNQTAFELDDEFLCARVGKVVDSRASASVISAESRFNSVLVSGEVILWLSLLPFNQNNDIVLEKRVLPFDLEVEVDGAKSDMTAGAVCNVQNLAIKVFVDENDENATITSLVKIEVCAKAKQTVSAPCVTDAVCTFCDLDLQKSECYYQSMCGTIVKTKKVFGKFICDVPENSRFLGVVGQTAEVVNCTAELADVIISAVACFIDGENNQVSRTAEFALSLPLVGADLYFCPTCQLTSFAPRVKNGQLEAEVGVRFSAIGFNNLVQTLTSAVVEGKEKLPNDCAITVYKACEGDSEWDVEKALMVDVNTIYECNPNLEFPLKAFDTVVCYRKKN